MKKRRLRLFLAAAFALLLLHTFSSAAAAAVTLAEPRFGVANQTAFNVTVTTAAAASCRYSTPFEKSFAEMTQFLVTGSTSHRINITLPASGQQYRLFVECSDAEKGSFDLSVDTSPPAITKAVSIPTLVIETPLQAVLSVETNENTICRYGSDKGYDDMGSFFKGTNELVKENYEKYHEAVITGLADKASYSYNITCLDLSLQLSSLARITFAVDTAVPPVITEIKPASGLAATSGEVSLSVTTNKKSVCSYGNTTDYKEAGGNFSFTTANHQVTLKLDPGQYKYYIKCLFEGPKEAVAETSFSIDNTPPAAFEVNDSQDLKGIEEGFTYYLDRLAIRFSAEDKESGIDFYNYSIIEDSSGKPVYGWATSRDSRFTVRDVKLKDDEKYYVQAYAHNRAGLRTELARSRGVIVNVLLNEEYACSDKIKDGDEADIDCGGSCPVKCANSKACTSSLDCRSNFCVSNACKAGNCTDTYLNQDEADVDCGGLCTKKCELDKKCKKSADCESAVCSEGTCIAEGPCANKVLDAGETDVDCGGICASVKGKKCAASQKCAEDMDCKTGLCGTIGKCANRNDIDADGIMNDADNCPDSPNNDQKDTDRDKTGDACDKDNDNDGMDDEWETKYGFKPLDASDAQLDADNDGLSNLEEFRLGTSPRNRDTDRDGAEDGREVLKGTGPTDPESKPSSGFALKATIFLVVIALAMAAFAAYSALKKGRGRGGAGHANLQQPQNGQQPQQHIGQVQSLPYHPYQQHRSHHDVFNELQKNYSQMSGEEIFDELRRKLGRK